MQSHGVTVSSGKAARFAPQGRAPDRIPPASTSQSGGAAVIKYVVIAIFVAVMVGVGIASRKKTGSVNEFFLGGRDVGPWLSAFAYGTTYFSAVLFVGYAGKIGFGFGLSSLWIAVGNALVGSLLAWVVLAKRTRLMTSRLGAMTVPSFFKERFGSNGLKIAAALIIFIFLVPYSRLGVHGPRLPVRSRSSASTSASRCGGWRS